MLNNITLQQIEIFLTLAEQLNQSEAAKELFINQSAVSRWIQRLENDLNVKLFDRRSYGVELTDTGFFLYGELKPVYEKLRGAIDNIRDTWGETQSILRVGCLDSAEIIRVFRKMAADFEKTHPEIIMRTELDSGTRLLEQIMQGSLDLIVLPQIGFGSYSGVNVKRVAPLVSYIAVSADSPQARRGEIAPELFRDETLYLLFIAEMSDAEARAVAECEKLGFTPRRITYARSVFALEMAVRSGRGFTIGGTDMSERFGSDIKLFPIDAPVRRQYVILAWNKTHCSALAEAFVSEAPEIGMEEHNAENC